MPDLTIGEIGKILQLNLTTIDFTQTPPATIPLDLTQATAVTLSFCITSPANPPKAPTKSVSMSIATPPSSGVVSYAFQSSDLQLPPEMGKNGVFRYSIQVTFSTGAVLISNNDGQLTIKEDSTL